MRVLTWNVNGLATILQYYPWSERKTYQFLLDSLDSDIICFQEVKCQRTKITKEMAIVPGYHAYFSFSTVKLGYSGTVVYVKDTLQPLRALEGITGILNKEQDEFEYALDTPADILDAEGRCVILDFGFFVLLNIYFPNDASDARRDFKMDYHRCVRQRIEMYLEEGKQILLVGDINAVHEEIDHCDPKQSMKDHEITDFKDLPHRRWLDDILEPKGPLIDMTRLYHPKREKMFTCWNTRMNSRPANFGTRIDYALASKGLKPFFKYSDIQPDILGSDHCPIYADFTDDIITSYHPEESSSNLAIKSPLLSSNFPEFSNQQKKLSNYFMKSSAPISPPISSFPSTPSPSPSSSGIKRPSLCTTTSSKKSKSSFKSPQKSIQSFFFSSKPAKEEVVQSTGIKSTKEEEEINYNELIAAAEGKQHTAKAWTSLFSAPEIPRCKVHSEVCLERTVSKPGPNLGRVFYICAKPIGPTDGPVDQVHCNFFQWKK